MRLTLGESMQINLDSTSDTLIMKHKNRSIICNKMSLIKKLNKLCNSNPKCCGMRVHVYLNILKNKLNFSIIKSRLKLQML